MPMLAFPTRYRPRNPNTYVSPAVLTPPDDDVPEAFDPNAINSQNQDNASFSPPPDEIPKPPRLNDTQAGASVEKMPPLNPDVASKGAMPAFTARGGAIMPPPGSPQSPAAAPAIQPAGPPTPPVSAAPASPAPSEVAKQALSDVANQEKSLASGKPPDAPKSNWAQRLGLAVLSMTKLAPAANQIVHPKWSEQEAAYQRGQKDIQEKLKGADTALTAVTHGEEQEALAAQKLAQGEAAKLYKRQSDPHFGLQKLDPSTAKDYVPWMAPDENGEYWVSPAVANTLTKPENKADKPFIVPEGSSVVDSTGRVIYTAPPKPDKPTGDFERNFLPAWAGTKGKTVDQLTPQERIQAEREHATLSQDPDMKAMREASMRTSELLKQMQLQQQPTPEQAKQVASDLITHRIAPEQLSSMFGGFGTAGQNFKRMVYTEAKKLNPEFDFEQSAAEYGLVKSPGFQNTIRYMDSVQNSIPLVIQRANELGNSRVRFVNGLANMGRDQLNDPKLKQFQTDALLVADEIAKILQGGGTGAGTSDSKLQQAAQLIRTSDSPQAIAAAMSDVRQLMSFRRKSLTHGTYMENAGEQPQQPGGKVATRAHIADYAKAKDITEQQATKEFTDSGYQITQ